MCGGTAWPAASTAPASGLSPRVRGNRGLAAQTPAPEGSIPACAGEPITASDPWPAEEVYPRVCGGTPQFAQPPVGVKGLSPRVRGNPRPDQPAMAGTRSIPACAGEPLSLAARRLAAEVYPRVCGGTDHIRTWTQPGDGLSPRVRGNPSCIRVMMSCIRSIPACAGEPLAVDPPPPQPGVYPRVCGGTPLVPRQV